jgi:hypothetical protein
VSPAVAAENHVQMVLALEIGKTVIRWGGLAALIHFGTLRLYMLAWLASGHQTSFKVKVYDTWFEIAIFLLTLALWLDKFNLL